MRKLQYIHIFVCISTVPSGAPTNLISDYDDTNELNYRWSQPTCMERGGEISVFEYRFGENIESGQYLSNSTERDTVSFSKLAHYTYYDFQVRANTSQGAGPFTKIIRTRTAPSGKKITFVAHLLANIRYSVNPFKHVFER